MAYLLERNGKEDWLVGFVEQWTTTMSNSVKGEKKEKLKTLCGGHIIFSIQQTMKKKTKKISYRTGSCSCGGFLGEKATRMPDSL